MQDGDSNSCRVIIDISICNSTAMACIEKLDQVNDTECDKLDQVNINDTECDKLDHTECDELASSPILPRFATLLIIVGSTGGGSCVLLLCCIMWVVCCGCYIKRRRSRTW